MAAEQPLYDLVLLLDGNAEDDRRAQILGAVEDAIGKAGEIVNKQDWGMRSLAFEIRHKKDADYHLLQFHGTPELLSQLDRTLRITDEVVRFRIIKLAPGTPAPPEHRSEPRPAGTAPEEVPAVVGGPPEEAAAEEAAPVTGESAEAAAPPELESVPEPDAAPEADAAPEPDAAPEAVPESAVEAPAAEESAPAEGDSGTSDTPSA